MANPPCWRCGQASPVASQFCGNCGAPRNAPAPPPQAYAPAPPPQPPRRKSRKTLFIVGGLAAVFFVGLFVVVGLLLLVGLAGSSGGGSGRRAWSSTEPEGLYVGTEAGNQVNFQTGGMNYVVSTYYYLFLPGGRYCYGLPRGGTLDDFEPDRAGRAQNLSCGTYKVTGQQIQFSPRGSAVQTYKFAFHGDTLELAGTTYNRVRPADGLRLDGVYANGRYTNTSSPVGSGGVAGETYFKFGRDGSFSERGFTGYAGSTADAGAATSEASAGSGTYRINGNTLALDFTGGKKQRVTFFVDPQNPEQARPKLIYLDGGSFLLRQ